MPSKVNRKPAVRAKRDPARTRRNLLEAGCYLFSRRGFDGVSVDEVVARAGCNKRMLYHYYGNKDGLYTEVLRSVFRKLEDCELRTTSGDPDTATAIRELLARYFEFLKGNPDFTKLVLWENLNGGRFVHRHPDLLSKGPILQRLHEILERSRARGEAVATTDSRHLLVLLIGVCAIHFTNRHTLKHSIGLDLGKEEALEEGLRLAQDVFLNGLLPGNRRSRDRGE